MIQHALRSGKLPLHAIESSIVGPQLRKRVQAIVEHQRKALGLLFFPYDLGYCYDPMSVVIGREDELYHRIDPNSYMRIRSGCRIPHAWVQDARQAREKISTLYLGSRALQHFGVDAVGNELYLVRSDAYDEFRMLYNGSPITIVLSFIDESKVLVVAKNTVHYKMLDRKMFHIFSRYRWLKMRYDGIVADIS